MLPLLSVPPALCFSIPLVVAGLALRTLILRQHRQFLLLSSLALFSLALLTSVAGILGLKAAGGLFTLSKVQLVVDNTIYAELGVSVLYLAVKHDSPAPWLPRSRYIKPYTSLLCSFLFCATAIGLATPFVLAIPPIIPPLVFLIFTLATLPLLVHLIYFHCCPPSPSSSLCSKKKPSKLLKPRKKRIIPSATVSGPTSLPRLTMPSKNTTTITVLIPPPLPSPASSSTSFPETDESKRYSHFKHPSDAEDSGPNEGSSCSTAILSGSKISTKLHEESEIGYAEHMDTDLEANPRFSLFTPTTAPSALALNIRKRALRLRMRSRSILIILLISQTFAILSGTLLLILGISDDATTDTTAPLRIVETAFIVLCVSGFTLAFYLHGLPLDNGLSPPQSLADPEPLTISVAQRRDHDDSTPGAKNHTEKEDKAVVKGDMIPHFVVDGGDCKGTSSSKPVPNSVANTGSTKYGLGIDKVFNSATSHFRHLEIGSQPEHLGSASLPSPHFKRPSITVSDQGGYDDEKFEDEGIELPPLAQLPSPPNTPRAEEVEHFWLSGRHYPYNQGREEQISDFDQENMQVGVMRPGIKVNVIREFEERGRYLEAVADVVDTAASEPGCTSSSNGGDPIHTLSEPRSPRVWFSQRTFSPTLKKLPAAITNDGPKSPPLKSLMLSPKSPTFPIFRSLTNPGSPGSAWKKAQKIKERLRRPLIRHRSATASNLSVTPLEIPAPTPCTLGHGRAGSASRIAEWYPFSSKNRRGKAEDKDTDEYWQAEKGQSSGGIEMADFVDLTDPFASPTPGFALPKWVDGGMAGSSSDVGHHRTMSGDRSELTPVRSAKGKEREWNVVDGGRESERIRGVVVSSKATMWGRVPVVVGNELGYDRDVTVMDYPSMLRTEKREKMGRKRLISMSERRVGGRVVTRPDSPMPIFATLSTAHSRSVSVDRIVGLLEDVVEIPMEAGIGLGSSLRRKREPIKQKGSQQSLRSVRNGPTLVKSSVPSIPNSVSSYFSIPPPPPPLWLKEEIELDRFGVGDERGRLGRREKVLNMGRTRNGSPIPIAVRTRLETEVRRKGSPVPILFRSSSGPSGGGDASVDRRYMREVSGRSSSSAPVMPVEKESVRGLNAGKRKGGDHMVKRYLEDESSLEVELNLEEMLLAQKLLRRLDSVYCCGDDEREDLSK